MIFFITNEYDRGFVQMPFFCKPFQKLSFSKRTVFAALIFLSLITSSIETYAKISYSAVFAADTTDTPNIIFILVDDLGWADTGVYGNTYNDTPNIDRLAQQGMRFTNAYAAAALCSPTRAAILTGKSPAKLHFEFVTKPDKSKPPDNKPLIQPSFPRDLPLSEMTFADKLNPKYKKGFFGKWHLTQENKKYLGWGNTLGPLQQGFDVGASTFGSHPEGYPKQKKQELTNTFGNYKSGEYPEDELTNKVISFLKHNKNAPFLLYWSLYYVHSPANTRCKWLYDKYKKKLRKLGIENPKRINYSASVETMDHYIGQVLHEINQLGIGENTVIIFTSDNGGDPRYTDNSPLRGNKWNLYEGGIRVPLIIQWPKKIRPRSISSEPVTDIDFFPTICELTNTTYDPVNFEGLSLLSVISERGNYFYNRNLYWHFPFYHPKKGYEGTTPSSAMRKGNYKLIYFYGSKRTELYDLKDDIGENHNLSRKFPGRTTYLKSQLLRHLKLIKARFPKENSKL